MSAPATQPEAVVRALLAHQSAGEVEQVLALLEERVRQSRPGPDRTTLGEGLVEAERKGIRHESIIRRVDVEGPRVRVEHTATMRLGAFVLVLPSTDTFEVHDGVVTAWESDAVSLPRLASRLALALGGVLTRPLRPARTPPDPPA